MTRRSERLAAARKIQRGTAKDGVDGKEKAGAGPVRAPTDFVLPAHDQLREMLSPDQAPIQAKIRKESGGYGRIL